MLNYLSEGNGGGRDHLGLVEGMLLGTCKVGGGGVFRDRVCQCDTFERQYGQECSCC